MSFKLSPQTDQAACYGRIKVGGDSFVYDLSTGCLLRCSASTHVSHAIAKKQGHRVLARNHESEKAGKNAESSSHMLRGRQFIIICQGKEKRLRKVIHDRKETSIID